MLKDAILYTRHISVYMVFRNLMKSHTEYTSLYKSIHNTYAKFQGNIAMHAVARLYLMYMHVIKMYNYMTRFAKRVL